ncbi:MAG: NUDIX hydrolase [Roseiflexaceae bacterium]
MTYTAPILTVDTVVFQLIEARLCVLLITRTNPPFQGRRALPGGYISLGETTHEALQRVLADKAGIERTTLPLIEQLYTFDTVARDPRGHAVSVAYMALGRDVVLDARAALHQPQFVPVDALPDIAFDHAQIVAYACERLRNKISYTNAIFALLPDYFTLSQLQQAYEAILARPLDKRNFRKKSMSLAMIAETPQMYRDGAHRPARLYRFVHATLTDTAMF